MVINYVLTPVVLAEETTQQQEEVSTGGNTSESTAEINTGDAGAGADTSTTTNYNENNVDGAITSDGCGVDGSVDCSIDRENNADVDHTTTSDSNTGQNSSQGADDGYIGTGDATATSNTDDLLNTNIVIANPDETATDSSELVTEPNDQQVAEPNDESDGNNIDITNNATLDNTATADSNTGENDIKDVDTGAIDTGDAVSSVSQVNAINTNIIGTNFFIFLFDILINSEGDIDLNALWKQLEANFYAGGGSSGGNPTTIDIENNAEVTLAADAHANTGGNNVEADSAAGINTGNAYAAANIFNLINTNIIGSNFFIGIINIFGSHIGNIILPNPEKFLQTQMAMQNHGDNGDLIVDNDVTITDTQVGANADSGNNASTGDVLYTETGDAVAQAASVNYLNLNLFLSNWYFALINNFGIWNGSILSWDDPSSTGTQGESTSEYSNMEEAANLPDSQDESGEPIDIYLSNQASLSAQVHATAKSGNNTAAADSADIITGRAVALARLTNFINTNIIGSRIFMPIINLFGTWTGDLIFAYPDLTINVSDDHDDVQFGDTVTYTVQYNNVGYEEAEDANVQINLPVEEAIIGSTGPTPQLSGNTATFNLGTVGSKEAGSFTVTTIVEQPPLESMKPSDNFFSSLFHAIVPEAQAAENQKALITTAQIGASESESNTDNNSSSVTKYLSPSDDDFIVTDSEQDDDGIVVYGTPNITVDSSNNTAEYVYAGDTVTFTAYIHNDGSGTSQDTTLYQSIVGPSGKTLTESQFEMGNVSPGQDKKLTFGLRIPQQVPPGTYESIISAEGSSEDDELVLSNESISEFNIQSRGHTFVAEAQAAEKDTLGARITRDLPRRDVLPYVLSAGLGFLWFVEMIKRRRLENELEEALQ